MILIEKLLLYACGAFLLLRNGFDRIILIYLIVIFIYGCMQTFFEQKDKAISILGIFYLILCLWKLPFCFFIPLAAFDLLRSKNYIIPAALTVCGIIRLIEEPVILIATLLLLAITYFLQYHLMQETELKKSIKILRDQSTEIHLLLKANNKELMEKQDSEVSMATLNERNRIARDIHDNVGHVLSRSLLQLGAVMALNKDENTKGLLEGLKLSLTDAMTSIRSSVHDLHDESVDLKAVIEKMALEFSGYTISIDFDFPADSPAQIKYCFLSIIREALSNTAKHSNGSRISITLREHPAFFQLVIKDDGIAYVPAISNGIGLESMQERVDALRGTLRIQTDNGFHIFVSIPK